MAGAALGFTVLGDGVAALAGKAYGRTRLFGKSLEGTTAGLLACLAWAAYLVATGVTPWWVAVPLLNLYFLFLKVPEAMTKAKAAAGAKNPTKAGWMYLFFSPYALAADLNDLA